MVVPFALFSSSTGMSNGIMKMKEKRPVKHVVTVSVAISLLIAFIIVLGIILGFGLPSANKKFALRKMNTLQNQQDSWKDRVRAVFAMNLAGPKNARFSRSIEYVKNYTLGVIRSLLRQYYNTDAQFAIQTFSTPEKTTISEFCDAPCTMQYIDRIDREPLLISRNPNQAQAIWQYYRYNLGNVPSIYILFAADHNSYADDALFEKDMEESNKMLEKTKLINNTETIFISDDTNAAHYFIYGNIIGNERSTVEIANLINDKLIFHYREDDDTSVAITTADALTSVAEEDTDQIVIQTVTSREFSPPTTIYYRNTSELENDGSINAKSSVSSNTKSKQISMEQQSNNGISRSPFGINANLPENHESQNEENDFIIERKNIFSAQRNIDNAFRSELTTNDLATITLPFIWTGDDNFGEIADKDTKNVVQTISTLTELNFIPTEQSISSIIDEVPSPRSNTDEYRTVTDDSARLQQYTSNTDSPVTFIDASSKFQLNDRNKQTEISEMSDDIFSDSFITETQTSASKVDATIAEHLISNKEATFTSPFLWTIDFKSTPDTNSIIDDSKNSADSVASGTTKIMSSSFTPLFLSDSTPLSLSSVSVTHNDIHFSANDNTKFSLRNIISDKPTTTEMKTFETLMSDSSVKELPGRKTITNFELISPLDIDDYIYSLEDSIFATTSTDFSDLTDPYESSNSLPFDKKDEFTKTTNKLNLSLSKVNIGDNDLERTVTKSRQDSKPNLSITEINTGDEELEKTVTESRQDNEPNLSFTVINTGSKGSRERIVIPEINTVDEELEKTVTESRQDNEPYLSITEINIGGEVQRNKTVLKSRQQITYRNSQDTGTSDVSVVEKTESSIIPQIISTDSSISVETLKEDKPELTTDTKAVQNTNPTASYETKLNASTTRIPMGIFNITVRTHGKFSSTGNNHNYLLLDEVSYMEDDESKTAFNIDDEITSTDGLEYDDPDETYDDLYLDDSLSSINDILVKEKFKSSNMTTKNTHEKQSLPNTRTTSVPMQVTDTVTSWIRNANDHHGNLISAENSMTSPGFNELQEEIDSAILANQEIGKTENAGTTLSQIIDPRKSDFTAGTQDENTNANFDLHMISTSALSNFEEQSNMLSLNAIFTTPPPEIEEIAPINTSHKKIVHHALTVLRTEITNGSSSTAPIDYWNSISKPDE